MNVSGVNSFSDWTAGEALAQTSANVAVGGRVVNADGRGVMNALVTMSDSNGNTFHTRTNPFGYYRLKNALSLLKAAKLFAAFFENS